ncbi:hypothetical protein [Sphingomonas sp. SRS2]|uniref:hypothetical protein n=1 Tax=Sphingomonas sp. SRS2 TaxID=133190 RepID=UPI00061843DC|nr:hypothetical protein [Sphingomonas sp. SRS2]KKC24503.1 hypothetical protein WP12_19090 [Sphingomonas sp. SRS2]
MRNAAGSALLFILVAANAAASAADFPAEERPRLDGARMKLLVKDQIALARKGRLKEAQRSLDRKLAAQKAPLARADLIEAFGVELYGATASVEQRAAIEASLDYLSRGVDAYRLLLGNDHVEVATALVRRAELERLLRPENPRLSTDVDYQTAYRIRIAKLGANAPITLSTLIPMAQLMALPSRANGDPDKIEGAAALLRQVIDGTAGSDDPQMRALHAEAAATLQELDTAYGAALPSGRRLQLLIPNAARACGAASADDVMVFSGDSDGLRVIRQRFAKARLSLRPCGDLLLFTLSPGTDPSPVLDLLGDISAGRMKGVRMNLIEGSSAFSR